MATDTYAPHTANEVLPPRLRTSKARPPVHPAWQVAQALASLRLTVGLLGMGIFIVFVGTLAQTDMDMWDVIAKYFSSYVAVINVRVFFPESFFPNLNIFPFYFPFPGGASIGLAMIVNLLAAHSLRFRVQASGSRLWSGLAITGVGIGITWLIIEFGHNQEGLQGEPFFAWHQFWKAIKFGLAILWALLFYPLVRLTLRSSTPRYLEAAIVGGVQLGLTSLLGWILYTHAELTPSSLRILWQLLQGGLAGLVLLGGSILLFRRRAGIVLIHAGILLMMFGQYIATVYNVEERMSIREGETRRYAEDIRTTELAIVDTSPADHDDVTVISREMLEVSLQDKEAIADDLLPFQVEVVQYHKNADLRRAGPQEPNPATAGLGVQYLIEPLRGNSGADSGGAVDLAAAYVKLTDKSGKVLGTYLVSVLATLSDEAEKIQVGDKTYEVSLRFRRSYKPYGLTLVDVVREDYSGTNRAKHFASLVRIVDEGKNVDREVKIWMNNPLRYAGETFYQSRYDPGDPTKGTVEATELQVVRNNGWMIPYVACMIVGVGLIAHFWSMLIRFLIKREKAIFAPEDDNPYAVPPELAGALPAPARRAKRGKHKPAEAASETPREPTSVASWVLLASIVGLGLIWLLYPAFVAKIPNSRGMDLLGFAQLPVEFEGRVKPMDTLARNALRILSNRETFKDKNDESQPAIRWLLDVVSESPVALDHRVVRIENLEVLQVLGLERRKGFRYAINEFKDKLEEFEKQVALAAKISQDDPRALTTFHRKIAELDRRLRTYLLISAAFRTLPLPDKIPTEADMRANPDQTAATAGMIRMLLEQAPARDAELEAMQPPRAIPQADDSWQPLATAYTKSYIARLKNEFVQSDKPEPVNQGAVAMHDLLKAYAEGNTVQFNRELEKYQEYVASIENDKYFAGTVNFEAFYNRFGPFFHSQWTYLFAFVLTALAWLGWSRPLNRASFWLIVITFAVHTFALVARMVISGKPPVTTLYSSAVFIGWAAVIFGMAIEILFRLGVGNIIASICGFATLVIASFLANTGDTMPVLEAVLDTQFWLSTHVVCITLGYSATFVAGGLGLIYLIDKMTAQSFDAEASKSLVRMTYGTVCFAMLFSFIGTVLGGLWADDSWGRFWGWDPKENGALIIVLWNALVLHARWGGLVRDRGFAVLAVGGNIATAWSWFGVNELGVGLHSYGFTEGVLLALGLFVLSQLAVMGMGCSMPRSQIQDPPTA